MNLVAILYSFVMLKITCPSFVVKMGLGFFLEGLFAVLL